METANETVKVETAPEAPEVLVIGDVHSCLSELKELLGKAGWVKGGNVRVILLGDLVDRGPDPGGVVHFVRENGLESLLGNHEETLLAYRASLEYAKTDPAFKIKPLLVDQQKSYDALTDDDFVWLESLPYSIRIAPDLVCVHGGLEPRRTFEDQKDDPTILRVRNVDSRSGLSPQGKSWKDGITSDTYWAKLWKGPECVIYGHEIHSHYTPQIEGPRDEKGNICGPWTLGLDTGCATGGYLTGYLVNRNAIVQVRSHYEYSMWSRQLPLYDSKHGQKFGDNKDRTVWREQDGPASEDHWEKQKREKKEAKKERRPAKAPKVEETFAEWQARKDAAEAAKAAKAFKAWKEAKTAGAPKGSVLIRKKGGSEQVH